MLLMNCPCTGAKGNQAAVSTTSEGQPHPDSSTPGIAQQAPDSHTLSQNPAVQRLTAASERGGSEGQTALHPTHIQPPLQQQPHQAAHTQAKAQSQAQHDTEEDSKGAEGSQQARQRSQAVAAVGVAHSDGLDSHAAAAEPLPVHGDSVPAQSEQQQQQQQHLSGQGSLVESLQGGHQSPEAQPLQKRRRPDAGVSAAAEEAAQEQASASKATEDSAGDDDADDTDGDENAEGAMQSEPSHEEDDEGTPLSAPVVTATIEVSRSAQPARRRQAPQRRTTPTPLASRGAGGSSGRKAAGRGGSGRGRSSTPAAKAAAVQKPRRSTSRITAGKRRRSPS